MDVSDECQIFYIFWLRTTTESTWKIRKLDWKTHGFFSKPVSKHWMQEVSVEMSIKMMCIRVTIFCLICLLRYRKKRWRWQHSCQDRWCRFVPSHGRRRHVPSRTPRENTRRSLHFVRPVRMLAWPADEQRGPRRPKKNTSSRDCRKQRTLNIDLAVTICTLSIDKMNKSFSCINKIIWCSIIAQQLLKSFWGQLIKCRVPDYFRISCSAIFQLNCTFFKLSNS